MFFLLEWDQDTFHLIDFFNSSREGQEVKAIRENKVAVQKSGRDYASGNQSFDIGIWAEGLKKGPKAWDLTVGSSSLALLIFGSK